MTSKNVVSLVIPQLTLSAVTPQLAIPRVFASTPTMLSSWVFSFSLLLALAVAVAIPQDPTVTHVRCPANDGTHDPDTQPGGPKHSADELPTFDQVLIPTDAWLQSFGIDTDDTAAGTALDDAADSSGNTPNPGRRRRDSLEAPTSSNLALRDEVLGARGVVRYFAAPNYRQIAINAGLIFISGADTATGGALVNIVQFAGQIASKLWHADHKFELNLLRFFLTDTPMRHGNDRWTYPHIWSTLVSCSTVRQRVTDILNSPANLVGVSKDINLLKAVLLQHGGPRDLSRWDAQLIPATLHYFLFIQEDYLNVARQLAVLLNDISGMAGVEPTTTDSPGREFLQFVTMLFNNALGLLENWPAILASAAGPGPNEQVLTLTHN